MAAGPGQPNPGGQPTALTGRRRLKTDALDLVAISDLLRAGHGAGHRVLASALGELAGWVAHRERRVPARTAPKNQLLGQVDRAFPGVSGCVSSLFGTKVGRLVLAEFTDPARLSTLGVAGFQQAAATRGVQVLAPVAERLVAAATVAIPTDQAPMPGPSSTATSPCWPPSTPRSPRPTSTWPPCCHPPRSPCCAAALAGEWSGRPPMGPRSATRHAGPAPATSIGPAGCAQQSTPRPVAAMTAPAAGKARSPCGGPCCRSGWTVAAGPRRPRLCRLPAGPRQAARGDRHRHGQPHQPDRLRHGQRPTTLRPQPVEVSPASRSRSGVPGWSAGGRIRHRRRFGGPMVTPRQAWCPASRHPAEPGRGQLTRSHARSHRSALGLPTRPATRTPKRPAHRRTL